MKKIKNLFNITLYDDGDFFECLLFPDRDSECFSREFFKSPDSILKCQDKIIYDDDSEYILPVYDSIEILPDRTGFIVIYSKEPTKFSQKMAYPWFFERPNNAAIYNADGSLRCQLKNSWEKGFIHMFAQPSMKYPQLPSVILDSEIFPNDSSFYDLYAIDVNTGDLLGTQQQIRL